MRASSVSPFPPASGFSLQLECQLYGNCGSAEELLGGVLRPERGA